MSNIGNKGNDKEKKIHGILKENINMTWSHEYKKYELIGM